MRSFDQFPSEDAYISYLAAMVDFSERACALLGRETIRPRDYKKILQEGRERLGNPSLARFGSMIAVSDYAVRAWLRGDSSKVTRKQRGALGRLANVVIDGIPAETPEELALLQRAQNLMQAGLK